MSLPWVVQSRIHSLLARWWWPPRPRHTRRGQYAVAKAAAAALVLAGPLRTAFVLPAASLLLLLPTSLLVLAWLRRCLLLLQGHLRNTAGEPRTEAGERQRYGRAETSASRRAAGGGVAVQQRRPVWAA